MLTLKAIRLIGPCECIRKELLQTEPYALVCTWRLIRFHKSIGYYTIVDGQTGTNTVNSAFVTILAVGQSPLFKRTVRYAEYFHASRSHSLECQNSIFDRMWELWIEDNLLSG